MKKRTILFFFGQVLMVVGVLIAVTTGLCTTLFFFLLEAWRDTSPWQLLVSLGVLPFVVGLLCLFGGRGLYRRNKPDTSK